MDYTSNDLDQLIRVYLLHFYKQARNDEVSMSTERKKVRERIASVYERLNGRTDKNDLTVHAHAISVERRSRAAARKSVILATLLLYALEDRSSNIGPDCFEPETYTIERIPGVSQRLISDLGDEQLTDVVLNPNRAYLVEDMEAFGATFSGTEYTTAGMTSRLCRYTGVNLADSAQYSAFVVELPSGTRHWVVGNMQLSLSYKSPYQFVSIEEVLGLLESQYPTGCYKD